MTAGLAALLRISPGLRVERIAFRWIEDISGYPSCLSGDGGLACRRLVCPGTDCPRQHRTRRTTAPRSTAGAAVTEATADELRPVEVPIPSEKALRFYHSGMWLWAFDVCWGLIVPAVIVFSGFSAVLRNLARRLGRWWFPTVGLYVVLYLAIVFLIDLPLSYYEGFVRQHAYGLSNQSLAKWLTDSLLSVGVR